MEKILIIKLGAIGDVVHSLPTLATLRACFPRAHIGWVVEEPAAPILRGNTDLSEMILLERGRLTGPAYLLKWMRDLRDRSYDTAVDLHNLLKTGIITLASGAGVRIGFRKCREANFLFMNRWVQPAAHHRHLVEKYLSLLSPLGVTESQWVRRFRLGWEPQEDEWADRFMSQNGLEPGDRLIAVNPGANWDSKRWMPERYAAVADRLIRQSGARIMVLWGPSERRLAETVIRTMKEKCWMAPPSTLRQLMALLKRCRLIITGDTGPLHIAAALGVPSVALFGPSDPARNGPYGEGHRIVQSSILPATRWQTKEHGDRWMKDITVEAVVEAAVKQLGT
jgi:lipopolysaccharide heptosyltransferase II